KLATVTGLTWTGNTANFSTVTEAGSYEVQLYKDGSAIGATKNIAAANVTSGVDFTSEVANSGINGGVYTFKVTAKGAGIYSDGNQSSDSETKLVAAPLAQVVGVTLTSAGVVNWDNVANESNYSLQLYKNGNAVSNPVLKNADE